MRKLLDETSLTFNVKLFFCINTFQRLFKNLDFFCADMLHLLRSDYKALLQTPHLLTHLGLVDLFPNE